MINKFLCLSLFFILPIALYAQKLPNVQKKGVRAPNDIKIDGNANEWDDKFQAYNHATGIFYSLANDDDNLYLIIHANDPDVLTKITNRGMLFCINTRGEKKDKDAISINYPVFEVQYGNKPYISFSNASISHSKLLAMKQNPDSVSKVANRKLHNSEKYIRVNGIPEVDTLLSIYNQEGIHAAESFDNTMAYNCELAISLKLLKINVGGGNTHFAYHLIFRGLNDADFGIQSTIDAKGHFHMSAASGTSGAIPSRDHINETNSSTDFWGLYTLKK